MTRSVLVTGGAGYVGSHAAAVLLEHGYRVVVLDNLQTGHRAAVPAGADFVEADLADLEALDRCLAGQDCEAVLHFAANSLVGESMERPFRYLGDNVTNALNLLRAMSRHGVKRFVLSSTANLYGTPARLPIEEDAPIDPGSPYGESKHMVERILRWADTALGIGSVSLRYFNAAGADPSGARGEDHRPETHLIPNVLRAALGQRSHVEIHGTDYATPDGTCIRDYVHVLDLAEAHVLALRAPDLRAPGRGARCYNLGNGAGYSVRQVIETARQVTGLDIPLVEGPRRSGDPAVLVASCRRIMDELGWRPRYGDLRDIIATAWAWHRRNPDGYGSNS